MREASGRPPWGATARAAVGIVAALVVGRVVGLGVAPAPAALVPLAVGSLYASANDRRLPGLAGLWRVVLPAAAGAVGITVGAALPHRPLVAAVAVPAAVGAVAGLVSRRSPSGSAAGLQLLALTALGEGLPGAHGAWWVPGALFALGAAPVAALTALAGGLAALSAGPTATAGPPPPGAPPARPSLLPPAMLRPGSAGSADAARLAACAAVAALASAWLHPQRGYWLLLTVALVVKPDLAPVPRRALHRAVGTFVGLIGVVALLASRPGTELLEAVVVAATTAVPWASARGYATLSAVVVPVVFALLALAGVVDPHLLVWRLVDTAAGLAIAVALGHPHDLRMLGRARACESSGG